MQTRAVYFNCDWQTFMAAIRDLENRIANENGTDTTRAVYVSGEVVGNDVFMTYDCLVLRDSVLSLQQQLTRPSNRVFLFLAALVSTKHPILWWR